MLEVKAETGAQIACFSSRSVLPSASLRGQVGLHRRTPSVSHPEVALVGGTVGQGLRGARGGLWLLGGVAMGDPPGLGTWVLPVFADPWSTPASAGTWATNGCSQPGPQIVPSAVRPGPHFLVSYSWKLTLNFHSHHLP